MLHIVSIAGGLVVYWCLDALVPTTFWASVHVGNEHIETVKIGAAVTAFFAIELISTTRKKRA